MTKCPSCGHDNVAGTQFCEMCGEELAQAGAAAAPVAGGAAPVAGAAAGADAGMIKCPACDNMNPAENVVCEVCGTELKPGGLGGAPTGVPGSVGAPSPAAAGAAPAAAAPSVGPAASDAAATPFDAQALSQTAAASTAASAPTPAAADTATATQTDASLPTVTISSADPQTTDPNAAPASPPVTMPSAMPTTAPVAGTATMDPAAAPVAVAPTSPVAAPTAGGVLEPGKVKLVVEQGMTIGKQFVLGDPEILVGREDNEEGIYPDVDLSDQDEGYVHRKHATMRFENGGLSVTHLGGANKTRVNNRPLPDNTPQPVAIGDKVAFGKVVLRVQSL